MNVGGWLTACAGMAKFEDPKFGFDFDTRGNKRWQFLRLQASLPTRRC